MKTDTEYSTRYNAVHERLRQTKGSASAHRCAGGCGRQAEEWAYDRSDPNEVTDTRHGVLVRHSADLDHYQPMCRTCHRRLDSGNRRKDECIHGHEFNEANTYWWRGERHCRPCRNAYHRERRAAARGGAS